MLKFSFTAAVCLVGFGLWGTRLIAAEPDPQGFEFFEKSVRPVLVERCYDCHSEDSVESGLRVDSLAELLKGGTRGPAIVVGDPKKSLLIGAINHSDQLQMPPKQKLSREEIAAIAQWVEMGAPWPNSAPATELVKAETPAPNSPVEYGEAEKSFWAFQPAVKLDSPPVQNEGWVQSPIDRFILAKLEAAQLKPAPAADKRTLIRRITIDLIGLPPTPEEVEAFLADESPEAVAKLVNRLLASPHYGERWARHWLDVARYADSNGLDENLAFANAYRYRDYVVAAFNADKPFNDFVQEQIAGDLIYAGLPDDPQSVARKQAGLTATSFLVIGAKMLAEDDPVKMQMDIIDEQVDTIGRAFMGLTLGCARCHNHKFDPISIEDYYALAGIFKSTKTMSKFSVVAHWQERPLASADEMALQQMHQQQVQEQQAAIDQLVKAADEQVVKEAQAHVGSYLLAAASQLQSAQLLNKIDGQKPAEVNANENGVLLIEAEDYTRGNVLKDHAQYGTGIGVLVNAGPLPNFVEYDFELKSAGKYLLRLRYAAADPRPVRLLVNGAEVKPDVAGQVTGSWFPKEQEWHREGSFRFQSGKNTIRLEREQPFPHIDRLLLSPEVSPQLAGTSTESPDDSELTALLRYQPQSLLVEQFAQYLQKTGKHEGSPFSLWNRAVSAGKVESDWPRDQFPDSILLADPRPTTLVELAARYEKLVAQAVASGSQAAQASPEEQTRLQALRVVIDAKDGPFALPEQHGTLYPASTQNELAQKRAALTALQSKPPANPMVMAVSEETPENLRVHLRGSHTTLGAEVPRHFPHILSNESTPKIEPARSGRVEMAQWLTSGTHPLTARVIVNRIWQHHFGVGLVRSPDNFGKLGQRPTHPELLDWLAVRFVEEGWSIKQLHRAILLSATYQMSTELQPGAEEVDPENELYWRRNRHRMEVEVLRDSMLAISGNLDRTMGGSLLTTESYKYVTNTGNKDPVKYTSNRRSIYLPVVRSALYNVFQAFDFAEPNVSGGKRDVTTVAPQALFMMNSELVSQSVKAWAERLLADGQANDASRIARAFLEAYARPATETEIAQAIEYINGYKQSLAGESISPAEANARAWQSFCRVMLAANEFIYVE